MNDLPAHYQSTLRRLIRFAAVFLFVGLLVGVLSTEYQLQLRYTPETFAPPALAGDGEGAPEKTQLPPGMMWESGFGFRISHGHFVLIGGVLPLALCAGLVLALRAGGRELSARLLTIATWLYMVGAASALSLILYKGWSVMAAVQSGQFDLAQAHANLFAGSRLIRALAHALTHTILAAGVGTFCWGLWVSAGGIGTKPEAATN